jgi:hypothetical protein
MPSDRTTVTELGTALGMLGFDDIDAAVQSRTAVMPVAPTTRSSTLPGKTARPF